MQLVHFQQYSTLELTAPVSRLTLIAEHTFIKAYGLSYYIFGWQHLCQQHPTAQIDLWLDCRDDVTVVLQAIYAKVTGLITTVGIPELTKIQQFGQQQGVSVVTTLQEIPDD